MLFQIFSRSLPCWWFFFCWSIVTREEEEEKKGAKSNLQSTSSHYTSISLHMILYIEELPSPHSIDSIGNKIQVFFFIASSQSFKKLAIRIYFQQAVVNRGKKRIEGVVTLFCVNVVSVCLISLFFLEYYFP